MNEKEIETIVTVSRSKSFYEAAFILNYSPSVISKLVANVEKEIGFILFIRSNRAQSISLTSEGETLLPDFIRIHESMQHFRGDLSSLQNSNNGVLRIGISGQIRTLGKDEVMADFFHQYPDVRVEQSNHDAIDTLVHMLYAGTIDGVFLTVLDGSHDNNILNRMINDPTIESFFIHREPEVYLGISDKDPLANETEAPLFAFRDYLIMFHPDQRMLHMGGTLEPFLRLSKKSGFELKTIFHDPRNSSSYHLATQARIAIPTLRSSFEYPDIKFVRVSDWDTFAISYFITMKDNKKHVVANFSKCVKSYIEA